MFVLLPPSEAKVPGGSGPSLQDAGVGGPDRLGPARLKVLEAVTAFCRTDPAAATAALKLPAASAVDDLAANGAVLEAPTMPALDRFSGVLYAALDAGSLTRVERKVALESLLVFSGAFGFLAGHEPVPVHRVPAAATVPGIGGLTPFWRAQLRDATPRLFRDGGLLVDLRSTDYAAMWQVTGPLRSQVVPVRVLVERKVGRKWVARAVSHPSKHGKGLLARELLVAAAAGRPACSAEDVAAAGERLGYRVETRRTSGAQVAVDLITRA